MWKILRVFILVQLIVLNNVNQSFASPIDPGIIRRLKNISKRIQNLEVLESSAVKQCAPLAHQERFNRGSAGNVIELQVKCPNSASTMINAGYAVYEDQCPTCGAPATGDLITSQVYKQLYTDSNGDLTPDSFNLTVSANSNFWVDIDAFCCGN